MVLPRMNLITLGARDFSRLRAFYQRLGWPESPASDHDYTQFTTAGAVVALFPLADLAEDASLPSIAESEGPGRVTLACVVESREQVDVAIAAVRRAGGHILKQPQDAFWGGYCAYFADPEGNVWEVAWNPHFRFDERGALMLG